ncbi:type IVB secretion system apparatus protein IcmL/DotI [Piscirickettsia litoralis]|uniref:Type IV secretion protein IcmL n=1 Tax=Piscirickettsia litoralis TaxID=1891921 RepID=A0ABX2ZZL5_9GAMM|nr:type IVB secretion system apparatus protein IcmL/DotI [Piscirickettsia litoralis]ODN41467.1 hypothetical protein BGC07_15205 [Piscirickettsia litoralis]
MASSSLTQVKLRNDFYKDNFRRTTLILLISILINTFLTVALIISMNTRPKPKYFATTSNGQLIQLHPLSNPVLNDSAVINWLSDIISNINSLDFLNYRTQVQEKRKYFTKYGWDQYLKAFKPIIKKVRENKYVVRAVVTDVPIVLTKGKVGGTYSWRLQVPMIITYQKGDSKDTQKVIWTVLVQRSNEFPGSIFGISQIIQEGNHD